MNTTKLGGSLLLTALLGGACGTLFFACKPRQDNQTKVLAAGDGDTDAFLATCSESRLYVMNDASGDLGGDQTGVALHGGPSGGGFSLAGNDGPGKPAFEAFQRNCAANCHTKTTTSGKLGDVLNYTVALKLKDKIKDQLTSGRMPPSNAPVPLNATDKATLLAWTNDPQPFPGQGGIPALESSGNAVGYKDDDTALDDSLGFISPEAQLSCIKQDYDRLPGIDKPFVRYVSFTHYYNGGVKKREWALRKKAFYKAINSVSRAPTIKSSGIIPIDTTTHTIFRVDLRAFKIKPEVWDRAKLAKTTDAAAIYPYGLGKGFTDKGRYGTGAEADLAALYPVRGDYFVREILQREKYNELLELGAVRTIGDLYGKKLSQDEDLLAGQRNSYDAKRAVFNDSDVNRGGYRVVEKVEANGTLAWNLFDFDRNLAPSDPHKDPTIAPLGPCFAGARAPFQACGSAPGKWIFQTDAIETAYQLPNGLFAYAVFDFEGKLATDNKVTVDPQNIEHKNVSGLSCISCHAVGLQPFTDAVGNQARRDLATRVRNKQYGEVTEVVSRIHPDPKDFNDYVNVANGRYYAALALLGIQPAEISPEPISLVVTDFERPLTKGRAAAELGVTPEELVTGIEASTQLRSLIGAFLSDQTLARDQFQDRFNKIVAELNSQGGTSTGGTPPPAAPALTCAEKGGGWYLKSGDKTLGGDASNWTKETCERAIAAVKFNFVCTPCQSGSAYGFKVWNVATDKGAESCTTLSPSVCALATPRARDNGVCIPNVTSGGLKWTLLRPEGQTGGEYAGVDACYAAYTPN